MKKGTKLWLITASVLTFVGCAIFAGVMSLSGWDFTALSTVKYETNEYAIDEKFEGICIITDTADIIFNPSDSDAVKIICYEAENDSHSVTVKDGTLTVEPENNRKWYDYIGINFGSPTITVYLPGGEYGELLLKTSTGNTEISKEFKFESIDITGSTGEIKNYASAKTDIKIKTSTGGINVDKISAKSLDMSVSTGKIFAFNVDCSEDINVSVSTGQCHLTNAKCENLTSRGNTGALYLEHVIAKEKLDIIRSTGDVKFTGCDAWEVKITTDTGDVTGSFLTDKVFFTETDTGKISVPKSTSGGKCEIATDTGDIVVDIGN